jgi:hypothetical protein
MVGGFILFVLWLTGLIVVSIELWGPSGSVSSNCNLAVFNQNPLGQTLTTLAWLEQKSICKLLHPLEMGFPRGGIVIVAVILTVPKGQSWQAVFALALIGAIFLLWIMVMAYQVFADDTV